MAGRGGEPIRPAAMSRGAQLPPAGNSPRPLLPPLGGGDTALLYELAAPLRSPAGNEAVLYHRQDDLWAAPVLSRQPFGQGGK